MKQKLVHALPVTLLALPASWVLAQGTAAQEVPPPPVKTAQETKAPAGQEKPPVITKGAQPAPGKVQTVVRPTAGGPGGRPGGMPGGMPPAAKPAWKQFKLNPKTTIFLDYTEASADAIISIFSRTSGITILKDPSFKVPLTVTSAKAVRLDEAFEIFNTVLGLNGYELKKQGNLMLVSRKQPPQPPNMQAPPPPPQPIVKTYVLQNAGAAQVAKVITEIYGPAAAGGGGNPGGGNPRFPGMMEFGGPPQFGGGGGAPGGPGGAANFKVTSDEYSNAVIVKALPEEQTKIEALIKDLDRSTTSPLVSELFVLKYVPAEQAVTAIEDLLSANTPSGRGAAKQNNNQNQGYFYSYNPFGPQSSQRTAGAQTATAIKATNSVTVNATKENIELIRILLKNLDQPANFVGTTFVLKLENAKASDVAELLNKVLQPKNNNQNENGFFFFDFFGNSNDRNKKDNTDFGENGEIVNVRDISGKVNIAADPNTNSLLIVTQPSNMRMIKEVVAKLDTQAEQVMIETVIVEANLDKTTKLGVEYSFPSRTLFGDRNTSGAGAIGFGLQTATGGLSGLRYTISSGDYQIFLNAVQTDTRFKVLDTPRIFTSNNVKAEIDVSQKLPYITTQSQNALGNIISNYQFESVGVILTVTPRITANGMVTMDVIQKADDLQGFTTYNAPIINHRQATTTVSVSNGETIVLGGMIRHIERQDNQKVPVLGDIPLLGQLFRSTSVSRGQTELMVFLTPHIVRHNEDAQRLRKDSTKDLTKPSQDSLKKIVPPIP